MTRTEYLIQLLYKNLLYQNINESRHFEIPKKSMTKNGININKIIVYRDDTFARLSKTANPQRTSETAICWV